MRNIKSNRVNWVDVARGVGIAFVVLGHTYRNNAVLTWITSFHMPLFFVLSGWLEGNKKRNINNLFLMSKAKSLLIPLVEFGVLTYIYWILVESKFRAFDIGPMWFLVVLFIIEILITIVKEYLGVKGEIVCAVLAVISLAVFSPICTSSNSIYLWIPRIIGGGHSI